MRGASHEELEAEKSLSGGNLSGSHGSASGAASGAAAAPDNAPIPHDVLMAAIYQDCKERSQTTYKLDDVGLNGDIEILQSATSA